MVKNNIDKNSPIGFFDSGVGGLSVYARFRKILPFENTIYFGDLKNLPYGNKTSEELVKFARNILDFFATKKVKAVVIACNTSSALAYDYVKNDYNFKIYPIIQSCAKVIAGQDLKRIGVFATEGTVKSKAYSKELLQYNSALQIYEIACPNWVSIVEETNKNLCIKDIEFHLKEMLTFNPDKIILGCTHYPYLIEQLTQYAPKELFIDPAEIFVKYIQQDLGLLLNNSSHIGTEEFFVSANPKGFLEHSKLFYNVKVLPQIPNLERILA